MKRAVATLIPFLGCHAEPVNDHGSVVPEPRLTVRAGTINRDGAGLGFTVSVRREGIDAGGYSPLVALLPPDAGTPRVVAVQLDSEGIGWADLENTEPKGGTWSAAINDDVDGGLRATFDVDPASVLPPPRVITDPTGLRVDLVGQQASYGCEFLDLDGRAESWSANCDGLCTTTTPGLYWVRMWAYVPPRIACGGANAWSDDAPRASFTGALTAVTSWPTVATLSFAVGSLYIGTENASSRTVAWVTAPGVTGVSDFSFLVAGMREPARMTPWFQDGWSMAAIEDTPLQAGSYSGVLVPPEGPDNAATGTSVALEGGETPGELSASVVPREDGSLDVTILPGANTQGYVVQVNGLGEPLPTVVGSASMVSFPPDTLRLGTTHALVVFASNHPLTKNGIPAPGWRMRRHVVVDVRRPG